MMADGRVLGSWNLRVKHPQPPFDESLFCAGVAFFARGGGHVSCVGLLYEGGFLCWGLLRGGFL